jgi:hypothetical protein
VDPVTGFSRRTLLALGVAVVLGVAASTVATMIEASRGDCPDRAYGCARFEPGEAVQIAAVVSSGRDGVDLTGSTVALGRPVRVLEFRVGCSVEDAAEAAREIATDPPDGPPTLAAVALTCPEAGIPLAQILDDSGISLVAVDPDPPPVSTAFLLAGPDPSAAAAAILEVAERVAVEDDGALLVPRTAQRDGLLGEGLVPVPADPGEGTVGGAPLPPA